MTYLGLDRLSYKLRVANVINETDVAPHMYHDTLVRLDYLQKLLQEGKIASVKMNE